MKCDSCLITENNTNLIGYIYYDSAQGGGDRFFRLVRKPHGVGPGKTRSHKHGFS